MSSGVEKISLWYSSLEILIKVFKCDEQICFLQGPTQWHVQIIMEKLLRAVNRTVIQMVPNSPHIVSLYDPPHLLAVPLLSVVLLISFPDCYTCKHTLYFQCPCASTSFSSTGATATPFPF